jgi:hypothetical protein
MLSVRARLYFEGRTDVNEVLGIVKHVQTFVFEIVTRMSVNLRVLRPTLMNIKSVLSFEASVFDSRGYARSNRYSDIGYGNGRTSSRVKDENDDTCIAFRGTSSIVDWDEQPPLVGPSQLDPQAMVHAGFFDAWESVKNEVYTAIDDNGMSKLFCVVIP